MCIEDGSAGRKVEFLNFGNSRIKAYSRKIR